MTPRGWRDVLADASCCLASCGFSVQSATRVTFLTRCSMEKQRLGFRATLYYEEESKRCPQSDFIDHTAVSRFYTIDKARLPFIFGATVLLWHF